ncbi:ParB/Srx family N-terminal domain-containing protein [Desulfosarcina sp. OttesenSCG-928-A07]|nr:ParB/Srx family N-terminal domain-containing protein [Desulfosarcina sp. OttesenSCG-928-G17]MDL2329070.1 ParB/Srx family N-terminal domain-containing protein [Desulfosarcina sp. OttesenSCG-928-A07]
MKGEIMKDISTAEVTALDSVSKRIFGDDAKLEIVSPQSLVLLKKNARVFKKDTFRQLTENIRKDGCLSSMPLCRRMEDGRLEVLSGNHRVQASIQANIPSILVMAIEADLSLADQIAIQISHNALVGEDDQSILAELWAEIEDIEAKLYAGLSSDDVERLEKIDLVPFTTPQVYSQVITFAFVDDEAKRLNGVLESLEALPTKDVYVQPLKDFNRFFDILEAAKKKCNVRNTSLAMLQLLDICEAALAEMPDPDTEPQDGEKKA